MATRRGLTFVTATVGINIVANFISPAFGFSRVNPQKISWRTGGMIAAGYYLAAKQRIAVDDMCTLSPSGRYWYKNGFNPSAVITVAVTGAIAILLSLFTGVGDVGWFIGCGLGFAIFALLERTRPMITVPPADEADVSDGTAASVL